jgi:hypothetical protein
MKKQIRILKPEQPTRRHIQLSIHDAMLLLNAVVNEKSLSPKGFERLAVIQKWLISEQGDYLASL